jgi:hypothetical protein
MLIKPKRICSQHIFLSGSLLYYLNLNLTSFKKMGDDGYSASELRRRYNKGGTLQDSDLSAAQLRARHNVKGRGL